jgi:hypothetical protein
MGCVPQVPLVLGTQPFFSGLRLWVPCLSNICFTRTNLLCGASTRTSSYPKCSTPESETSVRLEYRDSKIRKGVEMQISRYAAYWTVLAKCLWDESLTAFVLTTRCFEIACTCVAYAWTHIHGDKVDHSVRQRRGCDVGFSAPYKR